LKGNNPPLLTRGLLPDSILFYTTNNLLEIKKVRIVFYAVLTFFLPVFIS